MILFPTIINPIETKTISQITMQTYPKLILTASNLYINLYYFVCLFLFLKEIKLFLLLYNNRGFSCRTCTHEKIVINQINLVEVIQVCDLLPSIYYKP